MPSAGGLYLTRGCHFSNSRSAVSRSFRGGNENLWVIFASSPSSPAPPLSRVLSCASRASTFQHIPQIESLLACYSDLHLILMFSGPLQQDLFKEKWSLAKCCFKQNYCHACHTRFAVFFTPPSCCVSQHWQRELGIPVMWGSLYSLYLTYKFLMWFIMTDDSKVNFNVLCKPC